MLRLSSRNWCAPKAVAQLKGPVRQKSARSGSRGGTNQADQRILAQLYALSAHRKLPKVLKYSPEDLVKHNVIHRAWMFYKSEQRRERENALKVQYECMKEACDDLEQVSPELFKKATTRPRTVRFPREIRIPTDTPPNVPWDSSWKRSSENKK
ncbi:hypothetical protein CANCADRAFT_23983 [Tortispora caseinolytica NRRL Y-17796]|uniref:Large ribosomal subunit protein mL40 n=1 Tax=Tortispora caseinolytica NRRL Y-17796 TaxID=767744 RepID=A0A1E4TH87_9ASCO|nr:hypothetical protein CANCADRAFT_23983 [Tortispora caseinolytica NRRL Y-17796]